MLDLGRYLLGVVDVALILGFAWLAATALRRQLVPAFRGAPSLLATVVLALGLLVIVAEALGTFGALDPVPYLTVVAAVGAGTWALLPRVARGEGEDFDVMTLVSLLIAAVAVVKFGLEARPHLGEGMTGFDSTWYHGPFAAGFFQSGDTWDLQLIAPQFLAWFYPANSELFHSLGMLAFDRDLLSPLLNLAWLLGCLLACWCIGRPYGVAPWSMALGAVALSVPAFADQAGEARNDIVGAFFLLAAVALTLTAWAQRAEADGRWSPGALAIAGLAAGLAAGTKLNFLLPAAVLVIGLALIAPAGRRGRSFAVALAGALAGGGYWYLRNLLHTGNPLPWVEGIGPIGLPAPEQELGGRDGHSVLGYLLDGEVWSDWLLPGLADGLWPIWPLLLALGVGGMALVLSRGADPPLRVAALTGLGALLAWLVAPTSASGPAGMPEGFESGLRYLVPALALGLALLPAAPSLRGRLAAVRGRSLSVSRGGTNGGRGRGAKPLAAAAVLFLVAAVIGYPVQRHYLDGRYADPAFTAPGLNAAFRWARSVSDARIATTSTRQYPLFGTDLSNEVQFVGVRRPHGGFVAPSTCTEWRRLLNEGGYEYVVASRDRVEPGKSPYPPSARWTEDPNARVILRKPPTVVLQLTGALDPSAC